MSGAVVLGPAEMRALSSSDALYQIPTFLTTKAPGDTSTWLRDFSNALDASDTIARVNSAQAAPGDLKVNTSAVATGLAGTATAVALQLTGGTAGLQYTINIAVTTANGSVLSRQAYLCVSGM